MKLAEALPALMGEDANIVTPRVFARIMGGLDGGAILAHFVWWQANMADDDGWFWRTEADIMGHLEVTTYAIRKAREKAAELGILEQERRGTPAKMHYKLDLEALSEHVQAAIVDNKSDENAQQVVRKRITSPAKTPDKSDENAQHTIYKGEIEGSEEGREEETTVAPLFDADAFADKIDSVLVEVFGQPTRKIGPNAAPERWADAVAADLYAHFDGEPRDAVRWLRSLPSLPREGFKFRPGNPLGLPAWVRARLTDERHAAAKVDEYADAVMR